MRPHSLSLWLALSVSLCEAVRVPITRHKGASASTDLHTRSRSVGYSRPVVDAASSSNNNDGTDLTTVHDLLYIANVTIAGTVYPLQLDTGSSDLWTKASSSPIPNTKQSTISYNMTYGIGWAYGNVSWGTVEFAGIEVESQAFMDVTAASNPALSYGANGIIGLGFDSLSTIDALVNHSGSATGRTFLYNAFQQNKSEPNLISFTLEDDADPDDSIQGYFSIGEYEPKYAAVQSSSPISTWPVSYPTRWTVLLDALLVGNKSVSVSTTVSGAPSDKAVVVLDSGTSYTYAPTEICNAIYGGISGAKYDADLGQWVVPCDAEVDIALQFGQGVYPINPLDVSPQSLTDSSTCVGTFIPQSVSVGGGEFDWLIGDNVLRSVYAIYDFGDYDSAGKMGNPYIKLFSLVDADQASADFHSIRGGQAQNVTYNAANTTTSGAGSTTVALSNDLITSLERVSHFMPAVLALMAFNALVLILLVVAGAVYFFRRSARGKTRARKAPGRVAPMPMNTMSTVGLMSGDSPGGAYQPVSMALSDDAFVPPSPAFSRPISGLRPVSEMHERPMSVA